MSRFIYLKIALIFMTPLIFLPSFAEEILSIDAKNSHVQWIGRKPLGSHTGKVAIKSGKVMLNEANEIIGAQLSLDMTKITIEDLTGKENEKLMGELVGENFFNIKTFSEAFFIADKIIKQGSTDKYKIIGEATIKGVTMPMTLQGVHTQKNSKHQFSGSLQFDRMDYGVRYGSKGLFAGFGNKVIDNTVDVEFELETI